MTPAAAALSRNDMFDLAAYFAAQHPKSPAFTPDDARVAAGKQKAEETLCTMCHLGGFKG
jgi:cytochrome c553